MCCFVGVGVVAGVGVGIVVFVVLAAVRSVGVGYFSGGCLCISACFYQLCGSHRLTIIPVILVYLVHGPWSPHSSILEARG